MEIDMSMKLIRTINSGDGARVTVFHDTEWNEYQVRVKGSPDATYYTDDRTDAMTTATKMIIDVEANERAEEQQQ